jgi:hypothetical protein
VLNLKDGECFNTEGFVGVRKALRVPETNGPRSALV